MRVVVLASGGLDSTVLAYDRQAKGDEVLALFVNYGQPAFHREWRAAKKVLGVASIPLKLLKTHTFELAPDGYTYPARNLLLIGYATAYALQTQCGAVYIGCSLSDSDRFPDCRRGFLECMNGAAYRATGVEIRAPYTGHSKLGIWERGLELVDRDLLHETWSCYTAGPHPCGTCLSCQQRTTTLNPDQPRR